MFFYDSTRFRRRSKNLQQPVVCRCLSLIKSLKHLFCFFQEHKYMQTQQQQQHWSPTFLFYRLSKRAFFFSYSLGRDQRTTKQSDTGTKSILLCDIPTAFVREDQPAVADYFLQFQTLHNVFFFFFIILLLLYCNSFVRAMS